MSGGGECRPDARALAAALGAALRRGRVARGMSLRGWAKALGMSGHSGLVDYERGQRIPPADITEASERIFNLPSGQLLALRARALAARADDAADGLLQRAVDQASTPQPQRARPAQLPADLATFTGREDELDRLLAARSKPGHGPTVVVVDGMAGVGKTALAVRFAHLVRDRFPDGQLFLDLHGFTQGVEPVRPGQALARMLWALDVPGEQVPPSVDERAALLRTVLADRWMLLFLDNTASVEQVRPLVPAAPGCMVLVTSRHQLPALDEAVQVSLDTLTPPEAASLFRTVVGADRVDGHEAAVERIVDLCGRLPLAVRIAAARLRQHPSWAAADVATLLAQHGSALAGLDDGDRRVAAAFATSYLHLGPELRRAFRLVGRHPGGEFSRAAAAALSACPTDQVSPLLDGLEAASLLSQPVPGRYALHDLIRAFAIERGVAEDGENAHTSALVRLLDHYTATARTAAALIGPNDETADESPATGTVLADEREATEWLDTELANLLTAARLAGGYGRPDLAVSLSVALHQHLRTRAHYTDAEDLHTLARDLALDSGDRGGAAVVLGNLGEIQFLMCRYDEATHSYEVSLAVARETGHEGAEFGALRRLGDLHRLQGQYDRAVERYEACMAFAEEAGNPTWQFYALRGVGDLNRLQGRYGEAVERFERCLAISQETGHGAGEMDALWGLGVLWLEQGRHERAVDCHQRSLSIARTLGVRGGEMNALLGLADMFQRLGRLAEGVDHATEALALAGELDDRNGEFEALHVLGHLHHASGDPAAALDHHQRALALAGELDQRHDQARAQDGIARAHDALGHGELASHHWQEALAVFTELGTPEADQVRARLGDATNADADSAR